jgi:hypothetical protein
MTICTREAGPRWVWHPMGAGADLNLHSWVNLHPTRGGSGRRFQSAPVDPYWVPVYSLCTTILGPKTHGHPKPAPKPAGTQNPPRNPQTLDGRCPVKTRGHLKATLKPTECGCSFSPTCAGAGFHPSAFWSRAGFLSIHLVAIPTLYSELFLQNTPHAPLVAWTEAYLGE